MPNTPVPIVAWIAHLDGVDLRFWTGEGDLTFKGNTYKSVGITDISELTDELGERDGRMTISLLLLPGADKTTLLTDIGPVEVTIQLIVSNNYGLTWTEQPIKFIGRLSNPRIDDNIYTVELERYSGDVDRGYIRLWSHEEQMSRVPGQIDRAFEMSNRLSDGFLTQFPA